MSDKTNFFKYLYPNSKRELIETVLKQHGFELYNNHELYSKYVKGDITVLVSNEDILKSLTIYEIMLQSRLGDDVFSKSLKDLRSD